MEEDYHTHSGKSMSLLVVILLIYQRYSLVLVGCSYFIVCFSEYRESRIQHEREDYPVLLVEDVNHGQVASGEKILLVLNSQMTFSN